MASDNSKVIWFTAGVALGATISLLFAPASGEETRRMIRGRANEGRDRLADKGKDLMEHGRNLYDKGRQIADEAADLFDRGRKMVEG
ncbi:MAG: YtxH domain-containing protein [Acidobacteriota bacterium]